MPVRATTVSSAQSFRFERRAARQQRQAERQAAKEAKKNPTPAASTPVSTPVSTPATTDAASVKVSSETPKTETKNFIGNTAGANVVNFAVQGGRGGNRLAIFGSGEGPKAVKPEEKKVETTSESSAPKVDTVA